mmetsp:Transcript_12748/g.29365  ORF Transcript_12748/g.29365 Transcript_12748/m.29365 type:complete len:295 (-) Transcript_12748:995-1879(-)
MEAQEAASLASVDAARASSAAHRTSVAGSEARRVTIWSRITLTSAESVNPLMATPAADRPAARTSGSGSARPFNKGARSILASVRGNRLSMAPRATTRISGRASARRFTASAIHSALTAAPVAGLQSPVQSPLDHIHIVAIAASRTSASSSPSREATATTTRVICALAAVHAAPPIRPRSLRDCSASYLTKLSESSRCATAISVSANAEFLHPCSASSLSAETARRRIVTAGSLRRRATVLDNRPSSGVVNPISACTAIHQTSASVSVSRTDSRAVVATSLPLSAIEPRAPTIA